MRIAETPFGLIKHVVGLRQFLLRGLAKVKREWLWTCTAINLDKLARGVGRLRIELAAQPQETDNSQIRPLGGVPRQKS